MLSAYRWLRAHQVVYAGIHVVLLGWFVLGVLATAQVGHVDFPCNRQLTPDAMAAVANDSGIDPTADAVVVFISTYPAGFSGGGCIARAGTFAEPVDAGGFSVTGTADRVRVTGNRLTVTATPREPGAVEEALLRMQTRQEHATARWRTPYVGWPLFAVSHSAGLHRPLAYTAGPRSFVVLAGYVSRGYRMNLWALPFGLLVAGNAMYQLGRWGRRRIAFRLG